VRSVAGLADAKRLPIDTLGCMRVVGAMPVVRQARKRSPGEIPARHATNRLGRAKPRGASSVRGANTAAVRQGLSGGAKPRNRVSDCRPRVVVRGERHVGQAGSETPGCLPRGERFEGESQERCRCETKPAWTGREKTVERVVKPWGRNGAGRQSSRKVDLPVLMCCREAKPMRGVVS
jgi:hypothetical protein